MEEPKSKYVKNLSLPDLFCRIRFYYWSRNFTLIPFIIKYGKGNSWFSFCQGWNNMYVNRFKLC